MFYSNNVNTYKLAKSSLYTGMSHALCVMTVTAAASCQILVHLNLPSSKSYVINKRNHFFSVGPLLEDTIVRVRGFSPSTGEFKLARFFSGLNIEW